MMAMLMRPVRNHSWNVTPLEARQIQESLCQRVDVTPLPDLSQIKTVAGLDVSYAKETNRCYAAVVVTRGPDWEPIEQATAMLDATFPYVPGLLSFREGPALIQALSMLKHAPDLFLFDGQGLAHPRRFGLACHLGVLFDHPAVGCAKRRLTGEHDIPGNTPGAWTPLRDEQTNELIGAVTRTRRNVKPVYVSIGHQLSLDQAIEIVLQTQTRYRLPEPIRMAHRLSNEIRLADLNAEDRSTH